MQQVIPRQSHGPRRPNRIEELQWDLRFAVRSALRAPLFSALVVTTLALGIGANAAVFTVVKAVLLDALPYHDPGQLVRVYAHPRSDPADRQGISAGAATDIMQRQRSFEQVAVFSNQTVESTYSSDAGPRVLTGAWVVPSFFPTLGVTPMLGRGFREADAVPGAPAVVVVSHGMWLRDFGGDRTVMGHSVRIGGDLHEVVGVLPVDFVAPMGAVDALFPLDLTPTLANPSTARGSHWLGMVARLRDRLPTGAAARDLTAIAESISRDHAATDSARTFIAVPLRDAMVGQTGTALVVLMVSAALVLLIACANLAGAQLSRALSRRKEFAARVALGAGRARLVRQLLTESALLGLAGGAVGLLLAAVALAQFQTLAATALPAYADLSLDRGAVLVTAVIALATGLLFGLVPASTAGRQQVYGTLREEARGATEGQRSRHLRGVLVAAQIAFSLSLLVGAGLLVRSLSAVVNAPLGYAAEGVMSFGVRLPVTNYPTPELRARFFTDLEHRLRSLSGVTAVASASELPTSGMNRNSLEIEGKPQAPEAGPVFIQYASVSDDYFRALQIPLTGGRTFTAADYVGAPPAIVISESMARRYWPTGDALGARIRISPHTSERWGVIVGIVGDVRTDLARDGAEPIVYGSNRQDLSRTSRSFLLRTVDDSAAAGGAVQSITAALDPELPIHQLAALQTLIDQGLASRRLPVALMTSFALLALLLASVGVYAMFTALVAAREREFGIRLAIGARPQMITRLVVQSGAGWMVLGLAGGAVGTLGVSRLLGALLYSVAPLDPFALTAAVLALLACASTALAVPVRRAARIDPVSVLR